jgi:hypothetical protein
MARLAKGGRLTCESCTYIDIREWKRQGLLGAGQSFSWRWKRLGEPCGNISVRGEAGAVVLVFRSQYPGEIEWRSVEQRVPIVWTTCHLGGPRPWFLCNVYSGGQYCGRPDSGRRQSARQTRQRIAGQMGRHPALWATRNGAGWSRIRAT